MILLDTSVWVDHLRSNDPAAAQILDQGRVLVHPFVIGELALGALSPRASILADLQALPQAVCATDEEVMLFIEHHALSGQGVGYLDAHLLTSVKLSAGASLWTRDKRLLKVAKDLELDFEPPAE